MKCPHCDHDNLVGEIFCEACGQDLQERSDLDERLENVLAEEIPPSSPESITPDAPIRDAVHRMVEKRIGCLVVVDPSGRLAGIFTERDLLKRVAATGDADLDVPVRDAMTADPVVLREMDSMAVALHKMAVGGFRHLPTVDRENRPTGIYSVRDILSKLCELADVAS